MQYLTLVTLIFSFTSNAKSYISNDLSVYLHSGASSEYRIIARANAGSPIEILDINNDTGYTKIKTLQNKVGWLPSKYVSQEEGYMFKVPKLENELKETKQKLADLSVERVAEIDQIKLTNSHEIDAFNKKISELEFNLNNIIQENKDLINSNKELSASNEYLNSKLDTKEEDELRRFFILGALIMFLGLFLGIFLPRIIKSMNRSNNYYSY